MKIAVVGAPTYFARLRGFPPWPGIDRRVGSRYADAMARRDLIAEKLTKAFAPASLDVVDDIVVIVPFAG